ncbi:MAG: glycoside hydrolase family protein [Armatimonadota bacterium]
MTTYNWLILAFVSMMTVIPAIPGMASPDSPKPSKVLIPREAYPAPYPIYRMPTEDQGRILRHGEGPDKCDVNGMRQPSIVLENGVYYLFYDGCGPTGFIACLATSTDLVNWTRHGRMLSLGKPGEPDAAFAGSPWFIKEKGLWHMFYVTSRTATPPPDLIGEGPYNSMKATSKSLSGPWVKTNAFVPLDLRVGAFPDQMAYPGHIVKHKGEYMMFFGGPGSIGIARTKDLNAKWTLATEPLFDSGHYDAENSSIYYEKANKTWFMFVNHIGMHDGNYYTDGTWVFWTKDINNWDGRNRAIALDGQNCTWSKKVIGMATVAKVGDRLAIFYDAPGGDSTSHMKRDIGLAWLKLPLVPPGQ